MKKYILIAIVLVIGTSAWAQNEQDALRFSQTFYGGSARMVSMGGAFGALGGDFGAISINPAGIAVYRQKEIAFSTSFNTISTEALYLGTKMKDTWSKMAFNHFSLVIPIVSKDENGPGLTKLNFGFGYNKIKDFSNTIAMQALNNQNSLVDEFVYSANTNDEWDPFSDGLAWETYLIDYDSVGEFFYSDFDYSDYGQTQRRTVSTTGGVGEYNFSLGGNFGKKLYVGGSIGIQHAEYEEIWVHTETDPSDVIDYFKQFSYRNVLLTRGNGFNFKFGFIARPIEWLRVGGAIHTPTYFNLNDDFTSSMATDLSDGESTHYADAYGEFEYELTSPFRAIGSLAVILNQAAIISFDYEYVDYADARLRGYSYDFFDENQAVANRYRSASNIRVGGEYHYGPYFFRAGYALYGTAYAQDEPNKIQDYQAISGGFGYRTNAYYIDLGIIRSGYDQVYYLYGDNSAMLETNRTQVMATFGVRF